MSNKNDNNRKSMQEGGSGAGLYAAEKAPVSYESPPTGHPWPSELYESLARQANAFIRAFLGNRFTAGQPPLARPMITPDGIKVMPEIFLARIAAYHATFDALRDIRFELGQTSIEPGENAWQHAMGCAEGTMSYTCVASTGEPRLKSGTFRIFLQHVEGRWEVFHAQLPGFSARS